MNTNKLKQIKNFLGYESDRTLESLSVNYSKSRFIVFAESMLSMAHDSEFMNQNIQNLSLEDRTIRTFHIDKREKYLKYIEQPLKQLVQAKVSSFNGINEQKSVDQEMLKLLFSSHAPQLGYNYSAAISLLFNSAFESVLSGDNSLMSIILGDDVLNNVLQNFSDTPSYYDNLSNTDLIKSLWNGNFLGNNMNYVSNFGTDRLINLNPLAYSVFCVYSLNKVAADYRPFLNDTRNLFFYLLNKEVQ